MKLLFLKYFFFTLGVVTTVSIEITSEDTEITTEEREITTRNGEKITQDLKRYKVVSQHDVARKFYPEIRDTSTHLAHVHTIIHD